MRIFISAVTSEFGRARDAVAADFRARGHQVAVQSDFQQSPDSETLLGALADYIRDCHAVVCVVGKRSGASPPARAANRQDDPKVLPKGIGEASYTQWEFFLARHYKRRPFVYLATDKYKPDRDAPNDNSALQDAYLAHLKAEGVQYTSFSTAEELRIAAMRDEPKVASDPSPIRPAAAKPIVLPYPSLGPLFKGREGFMRQLHESLSRGGQTAITSKALYGLGGIGKTRAAVEYAWAHRDDYTALLFVVAETPEALRRNLAALASTVLPELDTTDDTVRLRAVLDWLATNPGWFLILDNVDTKEALGEADALLARFAGGHLIITSRLANFSANFEPLPLDVLNPEDATAFLLERTKGRRRSGADDEIKACEVARQFDQLALALEQAGAYIAKHRLTFEEYLEHWRSKRDEVLGWFDETVTGYPRAVAFTWQTSVGQVTEPSRRLLERLAWLAPERVPEFLLDVSISEGDNLHEALADLATYSLIVRHAKDPYFLVHRLVQDVTRRSITGERAKNSLVEALIWIDEAFPRDLSNADHWPVAEALAPHAKFVTEHAIQARIQDPTTKLMNQLGLLFAEKALHVEAEPLLRSALAIDEQALGPEHPHVATDLVTVAHLLTSTNRASEAETLLRRALDIDEKYYGPDHSEVAIDLGNLAALLHSTNHLAEAEKLSRRALAIESKNRIPDDPVIAVRLNNLAGILIDTGRIDDAEALIRRAIEIDEKTFGLDHPKVARHLNNLSGILQKTKRIDEAEALLRKALMIETKSFGSYHPSVAICLNNLALLLLYNGRPSEAAPLLRRALSINEEVFGPTHPRVANSLVNLTSVLPVQEREPLLRRALLIDENSLGPDHPSVAVDLLNLAQLLHETNRLAEAEVLMRRHVGIFVTFTRSTGHSHPHLEASFENYAQLLKDMGKSDYEIEAEIAKLKRGE